jgi:alkylation response protein AidB-like acyl-CoA dehydrogenase/predicted heme/steroid binding protein
MDEGNLHRVFTMHEVAEHHSAGDAWVAIDGIVYDVSAFHSVHPGGNLLLLRHCGKDASEVFHQTHHHRLLSLPPYRGLVTGQVCRSSEPTPHHTMRRQPPHKQFVPFAEPHWMRAPSPYYNAKHLRWQQKVRSFVEERLAPFVDHWEESNSFPVELHEEAYRAGILAPMFPPQYGGTPPEGGWDPFMDLILGYELGKCGSQGLQSSLFATQLIALPPLMKHGSAELKHRVATDLVTGKKIASLAITEPWAGSDVAALRMTAAHDPSGDVFVVNGEKKFITAGMRAHYFVAACRTDLSAPGHLGLSLLLIPADAPGVSRKRMKTQGWWAGNTAYITFENVRVPGSNLIGELHSGFKYIVSNFNHERLGMAITAAGAAHKIIEEVLRFTHAHSAAEEPTPHPIDRSVVRAKLADMVMRSEAHFALCEQLAFIVAAQCPAEDMGPRIALAKVNGTQMLEFVCREASQILGENAYARQGRGQWIERFYREVRVNAIGGGSEEILRDLGVRMSKL